MTADGLGYVVAVINQASGCPETMTSDAIHMDRESAEADADAALTDNRAIGRRERYVICELVPVDGYEVGT